MIFGYVRVSTVEQNLGGQIDAILQRYPDARILSDEGVSGITPVMERPGFSALMKVAGSGDVIVVAAIDRIGRNAVSTLEVVEDLKAKGITLISLREGFDATTPAGKLMLTMLAGIAEMERTSMLERQRAGIDSAKKAGKHLGRPIKVTPEIRKKILEKREIGIPAARIARDLNISRASVFRVFKEES